MENTIDKSLSAVHKTRKQLELDVQHLRNRIKLLQKEELKTSRKTEETRKRAKEVEKNHQAYEEKHKRKQDIKDTQEKELNHLRQKIELAKEKSRKNKSIAQGNLIQSKIINVKNIKDKRKEIAEKTHRVSESLHLNNLQKILLTKESQKLGSQKVKEYRFNRHSETRADYIKKIEREDKQRLQKEHEIKDLEKQETDLINQIQNTYTIKRETFIDLKKALRTKINRFH